MHVARHTSAAVLVAVIASAACSSDGGGDDGDDGSACGPTSGTVARVIDGDTVELSGGERIRYLLVDTPESTTQTECFGEEAKAFNQSLVEGREVQISYDVECRDRFDRLLGYITIDGRDVNALLLERGYACVLHIPPNGESRVQSYEELETAAKTQGKGLWGACEGNLPC